MARQIILLETKKASDGITSIQGIFWFSIASVNARVPKPQFVSLAAPLTAPNNVTTAEQTALENGSVREEPFNVQVAASNTVVQNKAELVRRYTDRATAVAAEPPTRAFYGVSYDGTNWSA